MWYPFIGISPFSERFTYCDKFSSHQPIPESKNFLRTAMSAASQMTHGKKPVLNCRSACDRFEQL
jgi:hypothetical protein